MTEDSQNNPNVIDNLEFKGKLDRIWNLSVDDMDYVSAYELRKISDRARKGDETDRMEIRPVLKKVLIGSDPWRDGAEFIRENLLDLVYSSQELEILKEDSQRTSQRKKEIEKDIVDGISPWLAHIRHNEQGIENPYIVGIYQNETGGLKVIYGKRNFKSPRQMVKSGREEIKEVNLLSTEFQSVKNVEFLKGECWNLLPDDLRSHFDNGEILITGVGDIYKLTDSELDYLADTEDPKALLNHLNAKIKKTTAGENKYFLLYYSNYKGYITGRTGLVMIAEDGSIKPLIIEINGKQFGVEVKGCGTKSGGFGEMHYRTGRDIVTGGAEREQAETEFHRLEDDKRENGPKAVGSILFDNGDYKQGYVIRLTPSTVRASYSGNECYPHIESKEMVKKILDEYSKQLAKNMYSSTPKILDRSSHTENLLTWGNGEFTFTDYSDHVAFTDKSYGNLALRKMLECYIEAVREIPGYVAKRDQILFYDSLNKTFQEKGTLLEINASDELEQVIQKIWERAMVHQVFDKRRKTG